MGGAGAFSVTNSFFNVRNITDRLMNNLGSAIEDGIHDSTTTNVTNNYVLNAGSGSSTCCGGYGWSLISKANEHPVPPGPMVFQFNYTAGHDTVIEWNVAGSTGIVGDNYFDWQNIQNVGVYSNQGTLGPYDVGAAGSGSSLVRNKEIPNISDNQEGNCDPKTTCGLSYIAGDTINVGVPAPPASGAGP